MALDPSIILGAKPVQFDTAQFSPMNAMTNLMKFKQYDQESELNALKMEEYKRARAEEEGVRNFLSGGSAMPGPDLDSTDTRSKPDLSSPDTRRALASNFGKTGAAFAKALSEQETAELTRRKTAFEVQQAKQKFIAQVQRDTSNNPSDANITAYKEDLVDNPLFSAAEKAQLIAGVDRILAMPVSERKAFMASQGASASELKPSYQQINRNGQTDLLQNPAFGGTPTTIGTYGDVPLPPAVEAQKSRIASAGASRALTNINTQLPASEEAQKEFMRESRQTFSALKQAPTVLDNIEKAKALVPQAKGFMGAGGESVLQAASFLNNRLGTSIDTKGVTSAEELRSRLFLGIMDNLKKLDSQPSQQQQAALQVALGSIGTDPSALPRVLDVFGDTIRQKVNLYNEEVQGAESRGVKFPYSPVIRLPAKPESGTPAAPGAPTSAPMYASNPKTGQRIMSTDGGNTWTPVR